MKYKFKYQQGGAPRVFNTPIEKGSIQPFAPLIQVASQPIETGFDAQRFIEQVKAQKLQEERLRQQTEFEKQKFAADLEQQKMNQEFLIQAKAQKIEDADTKLPFLAADMPLTDIAKEESGLLQAQAELAKNGSKENMNNLVAAHQKFMQHPTVRKALQRARIKDIYEQSLKDPSILDAAKEGYVDTTDYNNWLSDPNRTDIPKPKIKKEYDAYLADIETKKHQDAQAAIIANSIKQNQLDQANRHIASIKPLEDANATLMKQIAAETDVEKKKKLQILVDNNQAVIDEKYNNLAGISKTKTTELGDYANNQIKAAQDRAVYDQLQKNPNSTVAELEAAKKGINPATSMYSSPEAWSNFAEGSKRPVFNAQVENMNGQNTDGHYNSVHLTTPLPDGSVNSIELDNTNTKFQPSVNAQMKGDYLHISGTVYKVIPEKDLKDYTSKGWIENGSKSALVAGKAFAAGKGFTLVSTSGTMPLQPDAVESITSSKNPTPGKPLPDPVAVYDKNSPTTKSILASSTIQWGTDNGKSTKDTFLSSASDNAKEFLLDIGHMVGSKGITVTGHSHHDNPEDFDLRSKDGVLKNIVHTPHFKAMLRSKGYAIVYESPANTNHLDYSRLKPGDVGQAPLADKTSAEHYHFRYVGSETEDLTPKFKH